MREFNVSNLEKGQSLEKYVRSVLKQAPLSFIYKLFRKKDIKVNNHWQDRKYVVNENDNIKIYVTDSQLEEFALPKEVNPNDAIKDWIIYEDNQVLLVNKPRGILVQKDDNSSKKVLEQMVKEYLSFKNEYHPDVDLAFTPGPAHRIDRNTSGIVIFGKTKESLSYLFTLLKDRNSIGKHYIALVKGDLEKDGFVEAPLRKNESNNSVVVASLKDGGKPSKTIYHVLDRFGEYTLLDLTLVTGRTHQIRVHMSYIGHPVIGDAKYGNFEANRLFKEKYKFQNQFLHAYQMSFGELDYPLSHLSRKSFKADLCPEYLRIIDDLKENR